MSYSNHTDVSQFVLQGPYSRPAQAAPPPMYPMVPLHPVGETLLAAPAPKAFGLRQLLIAAAIVVVILVVMYLIDKMSREEAKTRPLRPNTRKQSTKDMARNLYKRLEDRGGVADTTMRSLKQLGRR